MYTVELQGIWIKFWNPEFGSAIEGPIWKTDFNAEKWVFGFPFFPFFGKSEKGFEKKTVYKHSVLADAHTLLAEKRTLFHENSFVSPFLHSKQRIKKESNITQSILRTEFSEVKPLFRFSIRLQNPKSGFQNLNLGFDVTLLFLSPSWLIFLLQHRAVRQLKSNNAQQLEVETKKMEERIRALKEQMFKEKEERE